MKLPTRAFANLVWRARCSGFESKFKKLGILCGMLVFTGLLAALFFNIFVSYAIALDGQVVGRAPSLSKAEKLVSEAENYASGELGYNFSFMGVTYTASIGLADDPEDVTGSMLSRVDALDKMCLVTVDGRTVGALESESQVNAMLAAITARYVTDKTVSIYFKQDVQVKYGYVGEYTLRDMEAIKDLLDPENLSSPFALTVVTEEQDTELFEVEYGSDEVFDMDMYEGEYELIREGVYGQSERQIQIIYLNGVQSEYNITGTRVVTEPVNEVLAYGAKVGDTESTGNYQWPCEGVITSGFGYRNVTVGSTYHKGVDIASAAGTPIYASDGGVVTYAGWASGYGNFVRIEHDNGDVTAYGHMRAILVHEGDQVSQGQQIGEMGTTGVSTGNHCHFEIRIGGTLFVDPLEYLPER